jgi:tetratricopeptide (TPR) repeat protein
MKTEFPEVTRKVTPMKKDVVIRTSTACPRLRPNSRLSLAVLAAITCSFGLQVLRAQAQESTPPAENTAPPTTASSATASSATASSATAAAATTAAPTVVAPAPAPLSEESRLQQQTEHYNNGLAALKKNNLEGAADHFQKTLTIAPDDAMARMLLGYVRLKQGKYDEALTTLQQAALSGASLDAKTRAIIQNNIGMAYWNNKQFLLALPAYERALKLDTNYADARYNLAFALLSQGRAKDAVPHFDVLIKNNPRDPLLHDGLGQAYESLGQWGNAFAAYRKAIALDPKDSSYPLNLGLAILRSDPDGSVAGRRDSAVGYLREAVRLNPEAALAYLHLGLTFIEKKRWPEAQNVLRQYVALRPDDFVGQFNLGLAYDYNAKFDDALRVYEAAAKLQPNDAPTHNNVGRIYLKRKKLDEAIAQFREALKIDPDFIDAHNNMGLALTDKGDAEAATAQWKELIASANRLLKTMPKPGTPDEKPRDRRRRNEIFSRVIAARAALAENYLQTKMYADAALEYKNLLVLAPNNVAAMSNRGLALYNTKEYSEALKVYDAIIKREPKNAIAHNNRGVVLEALNNRTAALDAYKKAIELQPDYAEAKANRDRLLAGTTVS